MHKQLVAAAAAALLMQCGPDADVPPAIEKYIADQGAGSRSLLVAECTYGGQTVYRVTRLDVVEASEAEALIDVSGKRLCRFTSFPPPGEAACDTAKLTACHRPQWQVK